MALEFGLSTRKRCSKEWRAFFSTRSRNACFGPALRHGDLHAPVGQIERGGALGENVFEQLAILEIAHDVNGARQIGGFQIELLEHGRKKLVRIEILEVFPIEIAAIDHAAAANVKEVHGDLRRLGIPGQDVGIVAGRRGDLLALFDLLERAQEVAVSGGLFVTLGLGSLDHARAEADQQVVAPPFEKRARVVRGFGIFVVGDQAGDARAPAAANVILEARARMLPRQIDGAGRDAERLVNEVHDAIGEAMGKERAEIDRTVFAQPARDVHARIFFKGRETNIGIGLVVPQQDIEFRADSA